MSSPTTTYVPTTPKAPKRKRVRDFSIPYQPFQYDTFDETESEPEFVKPRQQKTDEELMMEDWPIHQYCLCYTLEDVACENDQKTLEHWLRLFSPASHHSEEEHFYIDFMNRAIRAKLDFISKTN